MSTLFVLPDIPDDATPATKDALAARNQTSLTGQCPHCDVEVRFWIESGVANLRYLHDDWCPVVGGAGVVKS